MYEITIGTVIIILYSVSVLVNYSIILAYIRRKPIEHELQDPKFFSKKTKKKHTAIAVLYSLPGPIVMYHIFNLTNYPEYGHMGFPTEKKSNANKWYKHIKDLVIKLEEYNEKSIGKCKSLWEEDE